MKLIVSCIAQIHVLSDKLDTAKVHGLDVFNVSNQLSSSRIACRVSRVRLVKRVKPCCSTSSTPRTCRVVSRC